jgi:hypothetical protein
MLSLGGYKPDLVAPSRDLLSRLLTTFVLFLVRFRLMESMEWLDDSVDWLLKA